MGKTVQDMKNQIWRRIIIKGVVFAIWIASIAIMALHGGEGLPQSTYCYMAFIVAALLVFSTVRDIRRLRNEDALREAAIEESDERNVLIAY